MADIPGNSTTTKSISLGGSVVGTLETRGDHDWYAISLTAGQKVVISLGGWAARGSLEDSHLYIRNAAGKLLASNDDLTEGHRDSQVVFTVPTTGTYYIDVGAWDEAYTGDYQVVAHLQGQRPVFTYDQIGNQLTNGHYGSDWHAFNVSQGSSISVNLTALTADGKTLARAALASWSDIIAVEFVEVTTGGQIKFDDSDQSGAYASTVWSNHTISSASVNIPTDWLNNYGTSLNSYSYQTYLHEIGHAMGLGHAGNYNGTATYADALFVNDAWSTTLMSYFSQTDNTYFANQGFTRNLAVTPMSGDIAAMRMLYGLSTNTRSGDTVYGNSSTADNPVYNASTYPDVAVTIFDTGGTDTLNYSQFSANQRINLNAGTVSNVGVGVGNLTIAPGVTMERAIGGSGDDTLIGNPAANLLNGGAGADVMQGGLGNDTYVVDNGSDRAREDSSRGGTDLVKSSVSFALGAYVENLTLTGTSAINGTGNGLANVLTGNGTNNIINGRGGHDSIRGGAGSDSLTGGAGNDSLTGGTGADKFVFNAALNASTNVDRITDFSVVYDTMLVDNDVFTAIGPIGALSAAAFRTGTAAMDADDRIIYDSATGKIYYDADGNGAGAKVLFAQVTAGLALTNADFQIIG